MGTNRLKKEFDAFKTMSKGYNRRAAVRWYKEKNNDIKENIDKYDCIFVSSHASVREALDKEGIDFIIVYPEQSCKSEWVGRCFIREKNGESGCGAEKMYNNWDQWIAECFETGIDHREIVLQSKEHLSDHFLR